MRLYLDQMLQLKLAEQLRADGHDVVRASEAGHQVADDATILNTAIVEDRVLVTLDEHFGNWAVLPLSTHPGVIRLKVHPSTTENAARLLLPFLQSHTHDNFRNHLIIVSRASERWIRTG